MENGTVPALLLAANDRIYNVSWGVGGEDGDFLCECGNKDCAEQVQFLLIEYAAREGEPILAPGHKQVAAGVS